MVITCESGQRNRNDFGPGLEGMAYISLLQNLKSVLLLPRELSDSWSEALLNIR
jgi:hypothetical protein